MLDRRFTKTLLLAAAALLCLLQIGLFAHNITDRIATLSGQRPGQAPWALGQVESEYHRLNSSLRSDFGAPLDATEIRTRYDIFYSRVILLRDSATFESHRSIASFSIPLDNVFRFLTETGTYFDKSDAALMTELPKLSQKTQAVGQDVRRIALAGFQINWMQAAERERDARNLIVWNSIQTGILFFVLLLLAFGFYRQDRVRRRALLEVSRTKARSEAILQSAADAIIVCSGTGKVQEMNAPGLEMFGITERQAPGLDLRDLLQAPTTAIDREGQTDCGLMDKGKVETQAKRLDGTRFPVSVSLTRVDTNDEKNLFVAHVRDITPDVNAQKALREAHDEAKTSEKAKSDLLAVMSHETRTPLNGILGASELLQKTVETDRQRRLISAIETSAKLLLHHVNNVLDVSRMDGGQYDIQRAPFDLREMLADVIDSQQARAAQSDLILLSDISPDVPPQVQGDAQKIRQVLLNLIGNAIKFTDEGSVILEVEEIGDGPFVEFRVIDTGAGIEARQLDHIFDDFYTADSTYARRREGTGLGLSIVKRMVASMDGEVGAESVLGEGSLFWVRLPLSVESLETTPTSSQVQSKSRSERNLSILLVEDNAINRMITQQMLVDAGHHVGLAESGMEGARMAAQFAYDLILMDISMPDMDGIQTAQKIRADGGLSSKTPIVALTAYSRDEDLGRVKAAGMRHILTKPTSESALEAMILKVMGDIFLNASPLVGATPNDVLLDQDVAEGVLTGLGHAQTGTALQELDREMEALLAALLTCESAEDLDLAEIHRLTGSTGILGMQKLRKHLTRAEAMELSDPQDLQHWIRATDALWQDTRSTYHSFVAASERA
ncbi:ATP-binding protein [Cognatishimia sp.]|uniref:hybrid sensor histidine kinase/response regulator n=1 Tax=Cognatishimia sp. TaxID=2211648 RepID=UPI0035152003